MRAEMYEIIPCPQGRIATMPRPRGGDWLKGELASLKAAGVTDIVTLLTLEDELDLQLLFEADLCEELGIRFHRHPTPDRDVPIRAEFEPFIDSLTPLLEQNGFIAIHCRAGIGRSTVVAAALLIRLGLSATEAIALITHARGWDVPDTEEQLAFIQALDPRNKVP
jgi:protein-tyrosine phosphatase